MTWPGPHLGARSVLEGQGPQTGRGPHLSLVRVRRVGAHIHTRTLRSPAWAHTQHWLSQATWPEHSGGGGDRQTSGSLWPLGGRHSSPAGGPRTQQRPVAPALSTAPPPSSGGVQEGRGRPSSCHWPNKTETRPRPAGLCWALLPLGPFKWFSPSCRCSRGDTVKTLSEY